eukprot:375821-Rhodomonas_salina.1
MPAGRPRQRPKQAYALPAGVGTPVRDRARSATPGHDWWTWSGEGFSCTLEVPRGPPVFVYLPTNKWVVTPHPQPDKLPEPHDSAVHSALSPPAGPHQWGTAEGKRRRTPTARYGNWSGPCSRNAERKRECQLGCSHNSPLTDLPPPTGRLVWSEASGWGLCSLQSWQPGDIVMEYTGE